MMLLFPVRSLSPHSSCHVPHCTWQTSRDGSRAPCTNRRPAAHDYVHLHDRYLPFELTALVRWVKNNSYTSGDCFPSCTL